MGSHLIKFGDQGEPNRLPGSVHLWPNLWQTLHWLTTIFTFISVAEAYT